MIWSSHILKSPHPLTGALLAPGWEVIPGHAHQLDVHVGVSRAVIVTLAGIVNILGIPEMICLGCIKAILATQQVNLDFGRVRIVPVLRPPPV